MSHRVLLIAFAASLMVLGTLCPLSGAPLIAETEALTPAEQRKLFHLPPGFEIQLVAAEPDIQKPMNLNFDAAGRLWVTHSIEYPFPAKPASAGRDGVTILADFGPDGRARSVMRFADNLNVPIGHVPLSPTVALVHTVDDDAAKVLRLEDTDGDGKADKRTVILTGFGFDDTHGMTNSFTLWLDGYVYATHGFRNQSHIKGTDGRELKLTSGNTYRFRPDGTGLEQVTQGQVNPFGLTFDSWGHIFTADCHSRPVTMLIPGATYPHFGNPAPAIGHGPEMINHNHGSTGIAGVAWYEAEHFPAEFRESLYVGNPVTGRVHRDTIKWHGATPEAVTHDDFITCDDPWFRPVDIKLGPDGALYIADFYNCIIGHYEVDLKHPRRDRDRGRIWRVVYTGAGSTPTTAADLTKLDIAGVLKQLESANIVQRTVAANELVSRGLTEPVLGPARDFMLSSGDPNAVAAAMWVVRRVVTLCGSDTKAMAVHVSPIVRANLARLIAARPEANDFFGDVLQTLLNDPDPHVKVAAATAMLEHSQISDAASLLDLWAITPEQDTHLTHAARLALARQVTQPGGFAAAVAVIERKPEHAARLADIATTVPSPEAAALAMGYLTENPALPPERTAVLLRHVGRHIDASRLSELDAIALAHRDRPPQQQAIVLLALADIAAERRRELTSDQRQWAAVLVRSELSRPAAGRVKQAIDLAVKLKLRETTGDLMSLAEARQSPHWMPALHAAFQIDRDAAMPMVTAMLHDPAGPLGSRQFAADRVAELNTPGSREELVKALRTAPQQIAVAIAAALIGNNEGAAMLLDEMEAGRAAPALLQEQAVLARALRGGISQPLQKRAKKLAANLPPADARLTKLITERAEAFAQAQPDASRGRIVFTQHCAICHTYNNEGLALGPGLDGIGGRGAARLLEDMFDPNRNVDQAFRIVTVQAADGRTFTGIGAREEGGELVLMDAARQQHRVALKDVKTRTELPLSLMPPNVADTLTAEQVYDLLEYLAAR